MFSSIGASYLPLGMPILIPARSVGALILVICATGIASANHRPQLVIAVLGLAVEILGVGDLRVDAGSWVGPN